MIQNYRLGGWKIRGTDRPADAASSADRATVCGASRSLAGRLAVRYRLTEEIGNLCIISTLQANFESLVQIVGRRVRIVGQYLKTDLPFAYTIPFWKGSLDRIWPPRTCPGPPNGLFIGAILEMVVSDACAVLTHLRRQSEARLSHGRRWTVVVARMDKRIRTS